MSLNKSSISILAKPSPITKKRRSHKRHVSFNSMAEVCVLEPFAPSNDEENIESSELWWSASDYKLMKSECHSLARRKMYSVTDYDDDDDCECRGLERLMNSRVCRRLITNAVRSVTREQSRQRLDGVVVDSDLYLAEVYGSYSSHSTIKAKRLGRLDAQEARVAIRSNWKLPPSCLEEEPEHQRRQQQQQHKSTKKSKTAKQQSPVTTDESREPNSSRWKSSSSDRVPFQENLKFALNKMVTRQRRAWI